MEQPRKKRRSFWNYKPITNPFNPTGSFDGCMFETYDKELKFVGQQCEKDPTKVWTVIDGEGSRLYVVAGRHFVNRLGYLITEHSWESDDIEYRM